ncbi:MAG: hypothetical protein ABI579_07755, partial [Candidatus Sumerlaeota bacterium]
MLFAAAAALGAMLLHLFLLRDVWASPAHLIPGWPGDNSMFLWNLWWLSDTFRSGHFTLQCDIINYPVGANLAFHTNTIIYSGLVALFPIKDFEGDVLSYNTIMLLSSMASAVALFLIARLSGARQSIAVVVAVLMTFGNFRRYSMYGHLNLTGTEFYFFAVFAAVMAVRAEKPLCQWIVSGVLAGLAFWNDQTMGIMSLLYASLLLIYRFVSIRDKSVSLHALAYGLTFFVIVAFYLPPLIRQYFSRGFYVASINDLRATDIFELLIPSDFNSWVGYQCFLLRKALHINWSTYQIASLGVAGNIMIALWVGGILLRRQWLWKRFATMTKFHIMIVLISFVLVLGDTLHVAGHRLIPLPAALLRFIPVVNNL